MRPTMLLKTPLETRMPDRSSDVLSSRRYKIIRIVRAKPVSFINDWKVGAVVDVHKGPDRIATPPDAHINWSTWDEFVPGNHAKHAKEQL
jgi:hypothetical protein